MLEYFNKVKAVLNSPEVHKALAGAFVVSGFLVPATDQKYVLMAAVVLGALGFVLPSSISKRVDALEQTGDPK